MAVSGVFPVFNNQFKFATDGKSGTTMAAVADMETFSVSYDNNVEEWTPMDTEGWVRRLSTGKGVTISFSGKRNIGDVGNDYIAGLAFKTGQDTESVMEWTMPSGVKVSMPCVINVTSGGGDSTNVDGLEFDCMSNGKPTVTPSAQTQSAPAAPTVTTTSTSTSK